MSTGEKQIVFRGVLLLKKDDSVYIIINKFKGKIKLNKG